MRNLTSFALLIVILVASCAKNDPPVESNDYWSCEQLLDTTGMKLYQFVPFTEEERHMSFYNYKIPRRQVPEDFLNTMTTKELFYQIVYTDICQSLLFFDSLFERMNMVTELLNRPDAGQVFLELLQKFDPSVLSIEVDNCFYWRCFLQLFGAQPKVINRMTDDDLFQYIHHQLRCHEIIKNMCEKSDDEYCYCGNMYMILYGLGNVMIRYKFDPFIQSLKRDPNTNELQWGLPSPEMSLECNFQVIDYVKKFVEIKK